MARRTNRDVTSWNSSSAPTGGLTWPSTAPDCRVVSSAKATDCADRSEELRIHPAAQLDPGKAGAVIFCRAQIDLPCAEIDRRATQC